MVVVAEQAPRAPHICPHLQSEEVRGTSEWVLGAERVREEARLVPLPHRSGSSLTAEVEEVVPVDLPSSCLYLEAPERSSWVLVHPVEVVEALAVSRDHSSPGTAEQRFASGRSRT